MAAAKLALSLFALGMASVRAAEQRTIDDTFGDSVTGQMPTYSPAGAWHVGQSCTDCFVQPKDPDRALLKSWHDTTQDTFDEPHSVTVTFNGMPNF
jgi:hypothetical protein